MATSATSSPNESTSGFSSRPSSRYSALSSDDSGDFEDLPQPQTARKSTGRIDRQQSSAVLRPTSRGLFGPRTTSGSRNNEPGTSQATRVNQRVAQRFGIGKGSISRQRRIHQQRQFEERARLSARIRNGNPNSLMPMAPFIRLVHQIFTRLYPNDGVRFQNAALLCMRDISERFLINLFETANLFTIHARRVTLFPKDIILYGTVKRYMDKPFISDQRSARQITLERS